MLQLIKNKEPMNEVNEISARVQYRYKRAYIREVLHAVHHSLDQLIIGLDEDDFKKVGDNAESIYKVMAKVDLEASQLRDLQNDLPGIFIGRCPVHGEKLQDFFGELQCESCLDDVSRCRCCHQLSENLSERGYCEEHDMIYQDLSREGL